MRIFVGGLRDLVGKSLREALVPKAGGSAEGDDAPEEKHEIVGTVDEGEGAPPGVAEVAAKGSPEAEDLAASADVLFVTLSGNLEDARCAVNAVRRGGEADKVVIAASSVLTWGATPKPPRAEDADEDEPEPGFSEANFKSRRPTPRYADYKQVESHVMSLAGDKVRSCVVAAGLLYGGGENVLHSLFRDAWLCEKEELVVPALNGNGGSNVLPMVHVGDLAKVMLALWRSPPEEPPKYVVAVDAARSTLADVTSAIATALGTGKVRQPTADEVETLQIDDPATADLQANLTFSVEESVAHTLDGVEWAHKEGFVEHAAEIAAEYVKYRDTRALRIAIIGPPATGKSSLAAELAMRYYLTHVSIKELIDAAAAGDDDLAAAVSLALTVDKKAGTNGRLDARLIGKVVRRGLGGPRLRNRGWVLDGLPRTWAEAEAIFCEPPETEDGEEPEEPAEGESYPLDTALLPTGVVLLDGDDEALAARVRAMPEAEVEGTHNTEDGFRRRLNTWREANAAENPKATIAFFETRAGIETLETRVGGAAGGAGGESKDSEAKDEGDAAEAAAPTVDVAASVAALATELEPYVEKGGKPFNYHPTPEEIAAAAAEAELKRREAEEKAAAEAAAKLEAEREEREAREAEDAARLRDIEKQEAELLEARSEPLRKYLVTNVIPKLTEGLIEVCEVQPEDPVDYLAEYLFKVAAPDDEAAEKEARAKASFA